MSEELSLHRDYLSENRRMIIARSIAASMSGLVPIPVFEEWLTSAVRRGTVKRIAEARQVDIDAAGIRAIADGPTPPPQWTELAFGTLAYKIVARSFRKLIYAYVITKRTQAAARNFTIATLFDHYCARLHVGMGLDAGTAAEVRRLITEAMDLTPGALGERVFRRGVVAAAKASVRAPVGVMNLASGGAIRKLLKRGADDVEAAEEVDNALDAQLRAQDSFLARSAVAVELQLSAEANPYLDNLILTFEQLWRTARDAQVAGT